MELANQVPSHRLHQWVERDGDLAVLLTDLDLGAALPDTEPIPAVHRLVLHRSNEIAINIPLAFHDGLLLCSRQRPRSPTPRCVRRRICMLRFYYFRGFVLLSNGIQNCGYGCKSVTYTRATV